MLLLLVACAKHSPPPESIGWFTVSPTVLPWSRRLTKGELRCPAGPVTVAVHGIFGAGTEWEDSLPFLPADTWLYKWSGDQPVTDAMAGLEDGLKALEACGQPIVAIGHSAGGILLSRAAGELPAPTTAFTVFTVASPLGGIGVKDPVDDPSLPLFAHMGERIDSYPPPTPGITVVHLRTSPRSDFFSKPRKDHSPIALTVPGSTVYDLPETLNHNTSLPYAIEHIMDGSWTNWTPMTVGS